jgi:hypothetical protein
MLWLILRPAPSGTKSRPVLPVAVFPTMLLGHVTCRPTPPLRLAELWTIVLPSPARKPSEVLPLNSFPISTLPSPTCAPTPFPAKMQSITRTFSTATNPDPRSG